VRALACSGGLVGLAVVSSSEARALEGAESGGHATRARVAVLPVETRETLPESARTQLRQTITEGLERADAELVGADEVDREPGADACKDSRCAARIATGLEAGWIVRSTVTRVDAVYEVRLEAIDDRGRTLASVNERCEICGHDEVTELVVDRSAALAAKVRMLERRAPRLVLRSSPSGAKVWIDGTLVGRTPFEHEVTAGEHELRMELRGYATERRQVTAVAGTQETLELALLEERGPRRSRLWRGLGGAAVGLSTGMIGAGVGLALIDEREYQARCNPDPLGNCSHRYDTLEGGIALMVSGGVLLAGGVVALIVAHREPRAGGRHARRWRIDRGLALSF
jgi:hypothetical protein